MNKAFISKDILSWAIKRSKLSIKELAKTTGIKEEKLKSWEAGKTMPTFNQAQDLAKKLRVPFGYFFLSSPPEETFPIPDLRTIKDVSHHEFSNDVVDLINDILVKQEWYKEMLLEENGKKLPFIGKFKNNKNVLKIAKDINTHFHLNEKVRQISTNYQEFLSKFTEQAEASGILVFNSGFVKNNNKRKLSVEEFRGLAICDDFVPIIFINGNDAKAAKIFTLAHEIAHLWIGDSGISNLDLGKRPLPHDQDDTENICNQVAAEVLVPREAFYNEWSRDIPTEEKIDNTRKKFKVSSLVVLNRALGLRKISWEIYEQLYKNQISGYLAWEQKQRKKPGGNPHANTAVRNSKRLSKAIVSAAIEGKVLFRDAAHLLGVRVPTILKLGSELGIRA